MTLTPELTWRLIQCVFWFGIAYTIMANYTSSYDATISAVITKKTVEGNYWLPVVCFGLCIHWFWLT